MDGDVRKVSTLGVRRFLRLPPDIRELALGWIQEHATQCDEAGMRCHLHGPNGDEPALPAVLEVWWFSNGRVVMVGLPAQEDGEMVAVTATAPPPPELERWADRAR